MEIKPQRWLAVLYKCPSCGNQTVYTRVTPTKRHRERTFECQNWQCKSNYEIVERKYYTTFVIECSISFTIVAGTLGQIGQFKVCDIVHPNVRAFKKWFAQRKAEQAEQTRQYNEKWRKIYEEADAKRERERQQEALIKEAAQVAYRREHAAELIAEEVARSAWGEDEVEAGDPEFFVPDDTFDDDHPF